VFDHTCDNWRRCYKNSDIEQVVADSGGKHWSQGTARDITGRLR